MHISVEEVRINETLPMFAAAEEELAPLEAAAREVREKADDSAHRLHELRGVVSYGRERSREQQRFLERIEEEEPRTLDGASRREAVEDSVVYAAGHGTGREGGHGGSLAGRAPNRRRAGDQLRCR